jgi:hypothetical protein
MCTTGKLALTVQSIYGDGTGPDGGASRFQFDGPLWLSQ